MEKCLIIAAGSGSRLRYKGNSKPLVPILGIPLIERVIRTVKQAGIDSFCVVTGHNGEKVRFFLDDLASRLCVSIIHVVNEDWKEGNGLSVLKARESMGKEKFLLLMSDHLFDRTLLSNLEKHLPVDGGVTLAVDLNTANPLVDMEDVTRIKCDSQRLHAIGKDLDKFNGFDTGIFYCTSALFDALEWSQRENNDTSLSGGIRHLADVGNVNVYNVNGKFWIDVDDKPAFKRAESALLRQLHGKPTDGPISRYLNRPLSLWLSRYLARTPVTPNQISFISFIQSLVAAWLFALGGYLPLAAGAVLAQIASIIDGCDGEVARLKFLESNYGGWFDAVLDRYADAFLLFGLTWHAFSSSARELDLFVGFMAIIGSFILSYMADKYDHLMQSKFERGARFRMGRDVRVFFIFVGALLNQPFLTLLVIAILMNMEAVRRLVVCRNA